MQFLWSTHHSGWRRLSWALSYVSFNKHLGGFMQEMVHTEHIGKITMLNIYSTLSFGYDCGVISNVDGNGFSGLQRWKRVSFSHHMIRSSKIYQESFGIRSACHESMTYFMLWFPILLISPSKAFQKIDVIFSRREVASSTVWIVVWTLDFFLPMMPFAFVLLRARRLFMLLVFNFRLRSFEFDF